MADVAEDTKPMANESPEQEKVETTANGEEINDNAEPDVSAEVVKTNGEALTDYADKDKELNEQDTAKTEDIGTKDDVEKRETSSSKSPEHKRKEAPVSVTAHERHERKRTRGGPRYTNIKARFDDQPESSDPDEIRRQVEFYFSDSNLPIDAYLLDHTGGYRNKPVELKVIHNFKRMRHFQPFSAVVDAVKESKFLDLSDDNEITRKVPLDKKFTDDPTKNRTLVHTSSMSRSIYAKGFGDETPSTHLDIEAFFAPYGELSGVRLRRGDDGTFKGSVFVEFKDEETQAQFLELDPKPDFNGKELEIMSKQEYVDMKHQGIMDGLVKPKSPTRGFYGRDNKSRGRDNRGSRDYGDRRRSGDYDDRRSKRHSDDRIDKDDWKSRRDRDQDEDRRGRHGDRRGRGRGRDRGGRGGRGGRRASPDYIDKKKRRRSDADEERDEEDVPSRAQAEAAKAKRDEEKQDGAAVAGAEEVRTNGGVVSADEKLEKTTSETKKRAREDDEGAGQGEAKKVKEVEA